jgi:uncharacterized RDD family membrane protein YckC
MNKSPVFFKRLACVLYEAILLFGVVFLAAYLFDTLTQSKHALHLRHARQAWLFFVLGVYFVWFWTHGGQTLAMKTWRIRLVNVNQQSVSIKQALLRYLLCYPLALSGVSYLWYFFDKNKQFLHDRIVGTMLIE